jgi:hypothetical protein
MVSCREPEKIISTMLSGWLKHFFVKGNTCTLLSTYNSFYYLYRSIIDNVETIYIRSAKTVDKRILLFTNEDDPFGCVRGAIKSDMTRTTLQRAKVPICICFIVWTMLLLHTNYYYFLCLWRTHGILASQLNFFPWVAPMKCLTYLNSMLYVQIFYIYSLIYSLNSYWLDKLLILICTLHVFQDLIGLEGDDLVNFMASAGNKYGNLSTYHIYVFLRLISFRYHYVLSLGYQLCSWNLKFLAHKLLFSRDSSKLKLASIVWMCML